MLRYLWKLYSPAQSIPAIPASTACPPFFNISLPIWEHGPASEATAALLNSFALEVSMIPSAVGSSLQFAGRPKYNPKNSASPIKRPTQKPIPRYARLFSPFCLKIEPLSGGIQ